MSALQGRRIGLLTTAASRAGGGVFEAVLLSARIVAAAGATPVVVALRDEFSDEDRARLAMAEVHLCDRAGPAVVAYAPALVATLRAARLDLLHLHGIWQYPSRAATLWQRATGRPYFVSPHGMLDPWITGRGRWKKALARAGYERASWHACSRFHALTAREAADIARETGRGDAIVIPNPAPPLLPPGPEASALPPPRAAYIGRIHPKKNLAALVEAWRMVEQRGLPAGAELVIAGWGDEPDVAALRASVAAAGDGVRFVGPIFGAGKQALIAGTRALVLPSFSEGLPMAMLEAWAAARPTVMTEDCNLPEGFAAGAAMACGQDAAAIAGPLHAVLTADADTWLAMSEAATRLAAGPFAFEQVAARWHAIYAEAMAGESR